MSTGSNQWEQEEKEQKTDANPSTINDKFDPKLDMKPMVAALVTTVPKLRYNPFSSVEDDKIV